MTRIILGTVNSHLSVFPVNHGVKVSCTCDGLEIRAETPNIEVGVRGFPGFLLALLGLFLPTENEIEQVFPEADAAALFHVMHLELFQLLAILAPWSGEVG
ncbi:MAG: hypothetical protein WBO66_05315 [Candidatus Moraniibacteriota bacterium]